MLINPEWEEREIAEDQEAARKLAEAEANEWTEQQQAADLRPLGMTVPAWWETWQAFATERKFDTSAGVDIGDVYEFAQAIYAQGWRDRGKRKR